MRYYLTKLLPQKVLFRSTSKLILISAETWRQDSSEIHFETQHFETQHALSVSNTDFQVI